MEEFRFLNMLKSAHKVGFHLKGEHNRDIEPDSGLFSFRKFFTPEIKKKKTAFTLAEIMVSILVVAIIAALMIPAFMGNANDKSLSTQYAKMEKDIISQLESLAAMEGVQNFDDTSMVKKTDDKNYTDNAQAFLMKHFNVTKACTTARDCFPEGRKYKNGNGQDYNFTPDGACGHLKNGSVMCITPRYYVKDDSGAVKKDTDVKIWLDLNGKRKPNVYGEDLYIFQLKVTGQGKTKLSFEDDESNDNILDGLRLVKLTHDCSAEEFDAFCCKSDSYIESHNECCGIPEYAGRDVCTGNNDKSEDEEEEKNACISKIQNTDYLNSIDVADVDFENCCTNLHKKSLLTEQTGSVCCANTNFRYSNEDSCSEEPIGDSEYREYLTLKCVPNGSYTIVTVTRNGLQKFRGDEPIPFEPEKIKVYISLMRNRYNGFLPEYDISDSFTMSPDDRDYVIKLYDPNYSYMGCGFKSETSVEFKDDRFNQSEYFANGGVTTLSQVHGGNYTAIDNRYGTPISDESGLYVSYIYLSHVKYKYAK